MGAWKSEDGGSVKSLGKSYFTSGAVGIDEIVSSAANVRGVIIHIVSMVMPVSSSVVDFLYIGGDARFVLRTGTLNIAQEIFVPPGNSIASVRNGGGNIYLSYSVL